MLTRSLRNFFGHSGPYNPSLYKTHFVPRKYPKNNEIEEHLKTICSVPKAPLRNLRHVNPIRQSGPLPAYDGPYTMEDIRKVYFNTSVGKDFNYCSNDPEEIMRRVPGITRAEAEHITRLGLTPEEEIDYAYIAYHNGIDIFYLANQVYSTRQVVTNSKGEKTEIYWNAQAFEDISIVPVGHAPILENVDYHWEIFLWGEPAIRPIVDFDLSVPNTWFEYEEEIWGEQAMLEDQPTLPDDLRRKSEKHPNASKELWRAQEDWDTIERMKAQDWVPENLEYNVYHQENYKPLNKKVEETDRIGK
jgi:hypothetical protein